MACGGSSLQDLEAVVPLRRHEGRLSEKCSQQVETSGLYSFLKDVEG